MFECVLPLFRRLLPIMLGGLVAFALLTYIAFEDFALCSTLFFVAVFVGALPLSNPESQKPAVFIAWCLGLLMLLIIGVIAFNYIANPLGRYPTAYFEPLVLNHDTTYRSKVKLYDDMHPSPEVVVLGSSRSFTVPPAYITRVTGLPAFNASVHGGTLEDFLMFARHIIDRGQPPRVIIIGLSTELMTSRSARTSQTTERHARIDRELGMNVSRNIKEVRRLVSWNQTKESLRMIKMEFEGRPPAFYRFDSNGQAHFNDTRPLEEAVQAYIAEPVWGKLFTYQDENSPQNVLRLKTLLALCRDHNIQVIIYLPPFHPQMLAIYEQQRFPDLKAAYLDLLTSLQSDYDFTFYDFTTVESFNGSSTMFIDGVHPSAEAARLMLDIMLKDVPHN